MIATAEEIMEAGKREDVFSALLQKNRKFLLVSAFRACGKYVSVSDDEYSVAMRAFYEAVKNYDEDKGNFTLFCSMVIRRRILDYEKGERKHAPEIGIPPEVLDGEIPEDAGALENEIRRKLCEEGLTNREREMRGEIEEMQIILERYGFSFFDLTECSPKREKTRHACGVLVRTLTEDRILLQKMRRSGSLPVSELCEQSGIQRKIAERHRKYIIAAAEILSGDYPLLKSYVPYGQKGEEQS